LRPVLRAITTGTALARPARPLHAPSVPYPAEMAAVDQPTAGLRTPIENVITVKACSICTEVLAEMETEDFVQAIRARVR